MLQVSPPVPGFSLTLVCCFRQAAQPIALRTALSTALPATSLHLADEILSLMLLVDHFQSCSQLKDHLITSPIVLVPRYYGRGRTAARLGFDIQALLWVMVTSILVLPC